MQFFNVAITAKCKAPFLLWSRFCESNVTPNKHLAIYQFELDNVSDFESLQNCKHLSQNNQNCILKVFQGIFTASCIKMFLQGRHEQLTQHEPHKINILNQFVNDS